VITSPLPVWIKSDGAGREWGGGAGGEYRLNYYQVRIQTDILKKDQFLKNGRMCETPCSLLYM
jgi:hypothetical protein